jgi:hypothetical protein
MIDSCAFFTALVTFGEERDIAEKQVYFFKFCP